MGEQADLEMRYLEVGLLRPNPWNPNEQDEETFERLRAEIREVGFIDPIQVLETEHPDQPFMIIGGEHRWRAAVAEGMDKVPCVVLNRKRFADGDLQRFVTMRLNNLRGRVNPEKFVRLIRELEGKYDIDDIGKLMAFDKKAAAWEKLKKDAVASIRSAAKGSSPVVRDKVDESLKGAKPGSDLGKILKHILNNHGASLLYGFLVFSFGGKEHTYVSVTDDTKESIDGILEIAKRKRVNINVLLAPALRNILDDLLEQEEIDAEVRELDESL